MKNNDPMGHCLLDFFNGNEEAKVRVRSNFDEEDYLPASYLFRSLEELPPLEELALSLSQGRILDAGACAGVHALPLQERGFDVCAIDVSEGAVSVLKQRGVKDARLMNFFDLEKEQFDTILLLMNGLGMGSSEEGFCDLLAKARTLLRPGGFILGDSSDILSAYLQEDGSLALDLNAEYHGITHYELSYKEQFQAFQWVYFDLEKVETLSQKESFRCEHLFTAEDDTFLVKLSPL